MSSNERNTRRAMLTGGAAVVGTAAGAVLLGATSAEAADGNPVLAGRANTATAATLLTNSSTSGGAHGLLISTKGGYGFQAASASNHGVAGITASADKAGVLATHNGPAGNGAALIANGRNNGGAIVKNSLTDKPALLATATGSELVTGTAIRAVCEGQHGWGIYAKGPTAIRADSDDGTALSATCAGFHANAYGLSVNVIQTNPDFEAVGISVGAGIDPPGGGAHLTTAIRAYGDVVVNGSVTGSSGAFRIDHPLDPSNKYLSHSSVHSPDMKNVYDGTVVADGNGEAIVTMPEWFDELNKDLRYQLTAVGGSAPELHVKNELAGGQFTIAGAKPNQKVCWLVTGTRKDAWANAHRVEVETVKPAAKNERGTYLFPRGFNQPESKRLGYRKPTSGN